MENETQNPVQQRDEATIRLLAQLKDKLYTGNMSRARKAAHNLSWMQEDGFEILKEALFDRNSIKVAAAYGLRRVRGRMKPMAMEVLRQGLVSSSDVTREICGRTVLMLTAQAQGMSRTKNAPPRRYGGQPMSMSSRSETGYRSIRPAFSGNR